MGLEKEFLVELKKRKRQKAFKPKSAQPWRFAFPAKLSKPIKTALWAGLGLLLTFFIYQSNSYQGAQPTDSLLTRFMYSPTPPLEASPWPWQEHTAIHPAVAAMPSDAEASIKSVATYLAQHEHDPYQQVKALHDYVISRLTYDLEVLETGVRPSQEAGAVFRRHTAVCEGYAKLFAALAQAMGFETAYVRGHIRRDLAPLDLIPNVFKLSEGPYDWTLHAWNAIKVGDSWQLIDTTWDDSAEEDTAYSTDYLMPSPEVMIASHFPEQAEWQLLSKTINRKTFEAKPLLSPQFFASGLSLVQPATYKTEVSAQEALSRSSIQVNTGANYSNELSAFLTPAQSESTWMSTVSDVLDSQRNSQKLGDSQPCQTSQSPGYAQITCPFPKPGLYEVLLFSQSNQQRQFLGQLKFQVT